MPVTDVLIIGSGIAGLSVAIKAAQRFPHCKFCVITKEESIESNTRYAQGGIAVVSDLTKDSFEEHIRDTLNAGDGLCDAAVVKKVIRQAPFRLQELMDIGVDFDRDLFGNLILGREGGHHANRIVHCQDATGIKLSTALLEKVKTLPNITLLAYHVALDLITEEEALKKQAGKNFCYGAYVLDLKTNRIEKQVARLTVLATGGVGQLYRVTTNPLIATGDGIAMAYRAGAKVSNMEFVQFHPTALCEPDMNPAFLISEAIRGHGAYLRNNTGERFMFQYHNDGELACRDVVSRAIAMEILERECVYLDCTHIPADDILNRFPNIYRKCLSKGIDITRDFIPVAPAAHYLCGGIDVDFRGRTSVRNLYACGECSNTGLHGANRLASNSLLEATVFAHNCFLDIEKCLDQVSIPATILEWNDQSSALHGNFSGLSEMKTSLQNLMTQFAGIVRTTAGLHFALKEVSAMDEKIRKVENQFILSAPWHELRNMITCAYLIVKQSLQRKENKGAFYNRDLDKNKHEHDQNKQGVHL